MIGSLHPSVYIETPVGIMLVGSVDRPLSNLKSLHPPGLGDKVSDIPLNKESFAQIICTSYLVGSAVGNDYDLGEPYEIGTNCSFSVLTEKGKLIENKLKEATEQVLELESKYYLNYD